MRDAYKNLKYNIDEFNKFFQENFDSSNFGEPFGKMNSNKAKIIEEMYQSFDSFQEMASETPEERDIATKAINALVVLKQSKNLYNPKRSEQHKKDMFRFACLLSGIEKGEPDVSSKLSKEFVSFIQAHSVSELKEIVGPVDKEKLKYSYLKDKIDENIAKRKDWQKINREMEHLFAKPEISDMIASYKKVEEYWITSVNRPTEQIKRRLRFANVYKKELSELYSYIVSDKLQPEDTLQITHLLRDAGILELMRDYRNGFRNSEFNSRFLDFEANQNELKYRDKFQRVKERMSTPLPQGDKLLEFHKFLLRNGDYGEGMLADYRGSQGAVRPFIENFLSMSEENQLKSLQILENKKGDLKDYTPNMNSIMEQLKEPNYKFWRRINSSYINWGKLKKSVDQALTPEKKEVLPKAQSSILDKVKNFFKSIPGYISNKFKPNPVPKKIEEAIKGGTSAVNDATFGMSTADIIVSQTMSGVTAVSNVSFGLGIGTGAIQMASSTSNVVKAANRVTKINQLLEKMKNLSEKSLSEKQSNILAKLQKNTQILRTINNSKVKQATADSITTAASLGCTGLSLTGIGTVFTITGAAINVAGNIAGNKLKANETKDVVRESIFENESQKNEFVNKAKRNIIGNLTRLPKYLMNKYGNKIKNIIKSDDSIMNKIVDCAVYTSGQVNVSALKNTKLLKISKEVYEILNCTRNDIPESPESSIDKELHDLAKEYIKTVTGKSDKQIIDKSRDTKEREKEATDMAMMLS